MPIYSVPNYRSCFINNNADKITSTIQCELSEQKLSIPEVTPTNYHALGAIPKKDGSVHVITDCSKPDKISINNYMDQVFSRF